MNGLVLTPQSQAIVDHLLKFASAYPSVEVEITPIAPGGGHEVFIDFLPADLQACSLTLRVNGGRTEALFASYERLCSVSGVARAAGAARDNCFYLDMRQDYKYLNILLDAVAAGRVKPHSAVWFGRWLESLGAHLVLDEKPVYVGETQGFIRGILAIFRVVSFRDAAFNPWE